MSLHNIILILCYASSICLVNHVSALETEGINNGELADKNHHKYQAAIFGVKLLESELELVGSGALISEEFVISAAHLFVHRTIFGGYKLNLMSFYVRLGAQNLGSRAGELINADSFYLFDYDSRTGKDDLILIKLGPIFSITLPWAPAQKAPIGWNIPSKGIVSSYGVNNTENNLDYRLRSATARIVENSECDNILDADSTHICIKMDKDEDNIPRGLCKYDGGAPFVYSQGNYLLAIASKPKDNCDDTDKGSVYTNIKPFEEKIKQVKADIRGAATHTFQNFPHSTYTCTIC